MERSYVHGYDQREARRLQDQASTLSELLHSDSIFPAGSRVLEAGCGVGAQTVTLARGNPGASFLALDISADSLSQARSAVQDAALTNVEFMQGDLLSLPFAPGSFDHVFVCFVLEHLDNPVAALAALRRLLKPGGGITVIEGDHGSVFFYPDNPDARAAIDCQVALQRRAGGDALIGRRLYPLLVEAGYIGCRVSPRMVYVDHSKPGLVEGFTLNTFTAMVAGVREQALAQGLSTAAIFDRGVAGLCRTAESDGVFCYTFFKAFAVVPA